jgi:hypothetical protein
VTPLVPEWFPGLYRPLADGAVLLDPISWETHLLNAAAAAVVETVFQRFPEVPPGESQVMAAAQERLGYETTSSNLGQLRLDLQRTGLLARADSGSAHVADDR